MSDTPAHTPQAFAGLIAHMIIEGECSEHPYPGDPYNPCQEPVCAAYEPMGNDASETLNNLIATARRLIEPCDAEGDQRYRDAAREGYAQEGEIEIDDDNAIVSYSHNHAPNEACNIPGSADAEGAYVAAWLWVDAQDVES